MKTKHFFGLCLCLCLLACDQQGSVGFRMENQKNSTDHESRIHSKEQTGEDRGLPIVSGTHLTMHCEWQRSESLDTAPFNCYIIGDDVGGYDFLWGTQETETHLWNTEVGVLEASLRLKSVTEKSFVTARVSRGKIFLGSLKFAAFNFLNPELVKDIEGAENLKRGPLEP